MAIHKAFVCLIKNCLCQLLGQYQYSFSALTCLDKKCWSAIVIHGLQVIREALVRDVIARTLREEPVSPGDPVTLTVFVSAKRGFLLNILNNYDCSNDVVRLLRATLISRRHAIARMYWIRSTKQYFCAWKSLVINAVQARRVSQCALSWENWL